MNAGYARMIGKAICLLMAAALFPGAVPAAPETARAPAPEGASPVPEWADLDAAKRHGEVCLSITDISPPSTVDVVLRNCADHPIKLFREGYSSGDAHWRMTRIRDGHAEIVYQTYTMGYSRNFPHSDTLQPGQERKHSLDLGSVEWWASGGGKIELRTGDAVLVTYDVPDYFGAKSKDFWYGVVGDLAVVGAKKKSK